jgi:hypothetical protein
LRWSISGTRPPNADKGRRGRGHLLQGRGLESPDGASEFPSGRGDRANTVTKLEFRDAGLIRCVGAKANCGFGDGNRMNPCTLGWYLPLLVKDVPGALQPSDQDGDQGGRRNPNGSGNKSSNGKHSSWQWEELDAKFRRDLPDEAYVGRLAYRGLLMRACRDVKVLDGIQVSEKEKEKAERLLTGILRKRD